MELSQRMSSLKPSPTVALNGKAKELAASGIRVYNFSVGEPDFSTPDIIRAKAIESIQAGRTKYGQAGGGLALKKAISHKLQRDNQLSYDPEQIVVGMGAKEILFHAFMAILNEGDEVIVPAPYWVSYISHIEACGAIPVVIPMPDSSQGILSVKTMAPYFTNKTKAVVLTYPNNPAGYILDEEDLRGIGNFLSSKSCWVISDEIYEYLSFDHPHQSIGALVPELSDRLIVVNGMSKGFAMTGWRVGYCAAPRPVSKLVKTLQTHSSTCLPGFTEDASIVALDAGRELMSAMIDSLKTRRDMTRELLNNISSVQVLPMQGAFYAYLSIEEALEKIGKTSLEFSENLLEKYHVAMVPGEAFGTPGYLRLSYAASEADIREGISRLSKALAQVS